MKKKSAIMIAVATAFLMANVSIGQTTWAGYFEPSSNLIGPRKIAVVLYESQPEFDKAFEIRNGAAANHKMDSFSVITEDSCTIHMIDPKGNYVPDFLGTELTRCLYGETAQT